MTTAKSFSAHLIFLLLFTVSSAFVYSQPYLDVVNARYQYSPAKNGSTSNGLSNRFDYINISFNVPVQFSKDSSILVFSPFSDHWNISVHGELFQPVYSVALPVTYIRP